MNGYEWALVIIVAGSISGTLFGLKLELEEINKTLKKMLEP